MKDLLEVFNSEKTLKLLDNEYCNIKKISNEEKKVILSNENVKYYHYAGKDDEDIRKCYKFLKKIQDNAICIAEAYKSLINRYELIDERNYTVYKYFQVYLLEYNDKYYVLSKPTLMQSDDNVLMLQRTTNLIKAKKEFDKIVNKLQKVYDINIFNRIDNEQLV